MLNQPQDIRKQQKDTTIPAVKFSDIQTKLDCSPIKRVIHDRIIEEGEKLITNPKKLTQSNTLLMILSEIIRGKFYKELLESKTEHIDLVELLRDDQLAIADEI